MTDLSKEAKLFKGEAQKLTAQCEVHKAEAQQAKVSLAGAETKLQQKEQAESLQPRLPVAVAHGGRDG